MNTFEDLYAVAVATALLGKTENSDIGQYLNQYDEKDIQFIKEIQPVILSFNLSDKEIEGRIYEIFKAYND